MNWKKTSKEPVKMSKMEKRQFDEPVKMSKMSKEQFDKYSYTQSAKDKLSQIGKPPKQKDDPDGYSDYMSRVRQLRAQSQSGGTPEGERKALSRLENAEIDRKAQKNFVELQRKSYEAERSLGLPAKMSFDEWKSYQKDMGDKGAHAIKSIQGQNFLNQRQAEFQARINQERGITPERQAAVDQAYLEQFLNRAAQKGISRETAQKLFITGQTGRRPSNF